MQVTYNREEHYSTEQNRTEQKSLGHLGLISSTTQFRPLWVAPSSPYMVISLKRALNLYGKHHSECSQVINEVLQ